MPANQCRTVCLPFDIHRIGPKQPRDHNGHATERQTEHLVELLKEAGKKVYEPARRLSVKKEWSEMFRTCDEGRKLYYKVCYLDFWDYALKDGENDSIHREQVDNLQLGASRCGRIGKTKSSQSLYEAVYGALAWDIVFIATLRNDKWQTSFHVLLED